MSLFNLLGLTDCYSLTNTKVLTQRHFNKTRVCIPYLMGHCNKACEASFRSFKDKPASERGVTLWRRTSMAGSSGKSVLHVTFRHKRSFK